MPAKSSAPVPRAAGRSSSASTSDLPADKWSQTALSIWMPYFPTMPTTMIAPVNETMLSVSPVCDGPPTAAHRSSRAGVPVRR